MPPPAGENDAEQVVIPKTATFVEPRATVAESSFNSSQLGSPPHKVAFLAGTGVFPPNLSGSAGSADRRRGRSPLASPLSRQAAERRNKGKGSKVAPVLPVVTEGERLPADAGTALRRRYPPPLLINKAVGRVQSNESMGSPATPATPVPFIDNMELAMPSQYWTPHTHIQRSTSKAALMYSTCHAVKEWCYTFKVTLTYMVLMLMYIGFTVGVIYLGFVKGLWGFDITLEYNPLKDLQIEVAGCDVVFFQAPPGNFGSVRVVQQFNRYKQRTAYDIETYDSDDSTSETCDTSSFLQTCGQVQSVRINNKDCNDLPLMRCSPVCRIEIGMPRIDRGITPGYGKSIRIRQISDDTSKQVSVYNVGDVDICSKLIVTGSTLRLAFGEPEFGGGSVYINADMRVDMSQSGDYRLHGVTFGPHCSKQWFRSKKGSGRLALTASPYFETVVAKLNSINNYMCVMAGSANNRIVAGAYNTNASNRNSTVLTISEECKAQHYNDRAFLDYRELYDSDHNGLISMDDLRHTLHKTMGKCCGINCPLATNSDFDRARNCDNIVNALFPEQTTPDSFGRYGVLPFGDFLENLMEYNDPMLLKFCRPPHVIQRKGGDAAIGSKLTIIQIANQGEARFTMANSIVEEGVGEEPEIYLPTGKNAPAPGLKLLQESALQLANIRDTYGGLDATEDIYLTIHVVVRSTSMTHRLRFLLMRGTLMGCCRSRYEVHSTPSVSSRFGSKRLIYADVCTFR